MLHPSLSQDLTNAARENCINEFVFQNLIQNSDALAKRWLRGETSAMTNDNNAFISSNRHFKMWHLLFLSICGETKYKKNVLNPTVRANFE